MDTRGNATDRRTVLQGALAAVAAGTSRALAIDVEAADRAPLQVGIATLGFSRWTNAQLAKRLADDGFRIVQLFLAQKDSNYWRYNGRTDVSDLTESRCREIADTYRSAGIAIDSLGVYTNLIHPDPKEREANLAYFESMMQIGRYMGVRTFITEAGHFRDPTKPAPPVEYHFQLAVWKQMVETGRCLDRLAQRYEATVLFEPFYRHFFASAKRTRLYLEELDSPRLQALLDPANLLELNDLEEMFAQLGPWIRCLHAKDRRLHVDRGVPAGQGDLDYRRFVRLAARHTPTAPLILEYVGPDDYQQARRHLLRAIRAERLAAEGAPGDDGATVKRPGGP